MKLSKDAFGHIISPNEPFEPIPFAIRIVESDGSVRESSIEAENARQVVIDSSDYDPSKLKDAGIKTNIVRPDSNMRLDTEQIDEVMNYAHEHASQIVNSK